MDVTLLGHFCTSISIGIYFTRTYLPVHCNNAHVSTLPNVTYAVTSTLKIGWSLEVTFYLNISKNFLWSIPNRLDILYFVDPIDNKKHNTNLNATLSTLLNRHSVCVLGIKFIGQCNFIDFERAIGNLKITGKTLGQSSLGTHDNCLQCLGLIHCWHVSCDYFLKLKKQQ